MTRHISSLDIESFRGIKNLCLENLSPINILTGDNNSGKTSVLEVIESLDSTGNFMMWRSMTRRERRAPISSSLSYFEGIINLFNADEEGLNAKYKVTFTDGEMDEIRLNGRIEEEYLTANEYQELAGVYYNTDDADNADNAEDPSVTVNTAKLTFSVFINNIKLLETDLYDIQRRFHPVKSSSYGNLLDVTYISPVRHAEGTVFLNRVLDNPELYEQMLQILREFDPGIISINVDNSNEKYRFGTIYKVLSKEHKRALPLNVYGDGMKKAVLLMSAVIMAQGGVLLLDEFETAIHTTAMDHTFKWILETCVKLNVQLFLTTHSEEAIDKVLKCSPQLQDKIKVFTLYKNQNETVVRALDALKAIEIKDEMGLELR